MRTLYPDVMAERDVVFFQLRLPAEMHARLKVWSDAEDRSLHWIALRALREWLDSHQPPPRP